MKKTSLIEGKNVFKHISLSNDLNLSETAKSVDPSNRHLFLLSNPHKRTHISPVIHRRYSLWIVTPLQVNKALKIWWSFVKVIWRHCFKIMPTLMKLWRIDVTYVEQALNVCLPYGSIIKKTSLKIVNLFVDHLACIRCIWSLLCFLIYWNLFEHIKMCLLICWMNF